MKYIILLITFLLISACASTDHTEPPAPLVEFEPIIQLKRLWTGHTGASAKEKHLQLTPAYSNNLVFTASPKGHVRAINLETGKRQWAKKLEDVSISGGLSTSLDHILLGSSEGQVFALSQKEGTTLWQVQVSSEILSPPIVSDGIVIVRTVDGKVFALDESSGAQLWTYERRVPLLSLRGTSTPLIEDSFVFVGLDNGKLAILDLQTGKPLWEAPIAVVKGRSDIERMRDIDADPKLYGNTLYATSFQGRLVAIDMQTGKDIWKREVSSHAGIEVDSEAVYLSDENSHVWAFDRYSGRSLWRQTKLQARAITAPAIIDDYVVVGDIEGYLHWMKRSDGQFVARYKVDSAAINVPPLVINNTLIALTTEGDIAAIQP